MNLTKINNYLTSTEMDLYKEFLAVEIPQFAKDEMPYGLDLMLIYEELYNCSLVENNDSFVIRDELFDKHVFDSLLKIIMEKENITDVKFVSLMFSVLLILYRLVKSDLKKQFR